MTGVSPACNRARALISQRLDGPLSNVEERGVSNHTARCVACREFELQGRWVTEELRATPLERPSRPVIISPVRVRRVTTRHVGNLASTAAVLLVAVGVGAMGVASSGDGPNKSRRAPNAAAESVSDDSLRALRFEALRAGELQILPEADPQPHGKAPRPAID